jgi:hypothetical protein
MIRVIALAALYAVFPTISDAKASKPQVATAPDWRSLASRDDMRRLRTWREAFVQGLAEARAGGNEASIAAEGALLEPDAALDAPALRAGSYRCRTLKLGSAENATLAFVAYPPFDCRVTVQGDVARFEKLSGSQRPTGLLYPGGARRQVFLGTLVLGDETRALGYGRDALRDMVGAVERVGPQRWRLIFPYPRFESTIDVVELIPAS